MINFLSAVQGSGTNAALALEAYTELRAGLLANLVEQYRRSGYLWENYNDTLGDGHGSHPFTGWTALLVLIAGESYFDV